MPDVANYAVKNLAFNPSRRQLGAFGAIAAIWSGNANATTLNGYKKPVKVRSLAVQNKGMLFRPETGEHPGLVMFASLHATRSANAAVAEQLVSQGWSVLLVETKAVDDPAHFTRCARAHVDWLVAQPGVAATMAHPANERGSMHGFILRNVSAAQPSLSLASLEERRCAAACNILFAAPGALLANDQTRFESLSGAARALYRRAA